MDEILAINNVSRKWFQTARFHPYGRIVFIAPLYLHPNRTDPTPNIWNLNRTERSIKYLQKKIYE